MVYGWNSIVYVKLERMIQGGVPLWIEKDDNEIAFREKMQSLVQSYIDKPYRVSYDIILCILFPECVWTGDPKGRSYV